MNADRSGQASASASATARYSTPVWSPRGDYIAFTKIGSGNFAIGVMKPDGSGERILTEGFHNEGPTLVAERPRADVLPRSGRQCRADALSRSTSPAATSSRSRHRDLRRIRRGLRCCDSGAVFSAGECFAAPGWRVKTAIQLP